MTEIENLSDSDGPIIDDNIIRIQLRKPRQRKWELRTRNLSPGVRFPTIQLFDCEGNLLVETNDDNVSIKSCDINEPALRTRSLREKDFKHYIEKKPLKKHNTISGGRIYTRVFRGTSPVTGNVENNQRYIISDSNGVVNIPSKLTLYNFPNLQANSLDTTPFQSDGLSEISSYKSSDNETCDDINQPVKETAVSETVLNGVISPNNLTLPSVLSTNETNQSNTVSDKENEVDLGLHKSRSFNDNALRGSTKGFRSVTLSRSKSGVCVYKPPHNKVSFLSTYLKSLPARTTPNPDWFTLHQRKKIENPQNSRKRRDSPKFTQEKTWRSCKRGDNTSDNDFINISTDVAADCEMKKRLKMYRRGLSEIETRNRRPSVFMKRRHSVSEVTTLVHTSSSESIDEADLVLNRLKRRILRNKSREKRQSIGAKYIFSEYFIFFFF